MQEFPGTREYGTSFFGVVADRHDVRYILAEQSHYVLRVLTGNINAYSRMAVSPADSALSVQAALAGPCRLTRCFETARSSTLEG
jgi:hypothetical protein